jgi:rRNA-processing protein FCF1
MLLVLDTSILMNAGRVHLVFDELTQVLGSVEIAVPETVMKELTRLASKRTKRGMDAKLGLEIARGLKVLKGGRSADSDLLELSKSKGTIVATSDGALLRAIRSAGRAVVTLRRNRLVILGRVE